MRSFRTRHFGVGMAIIAAFSVAGCRRAATARGDATSSGPTSQHGVSADVMAAAGTLRQFIGEKLVQSRDEATYDARVTVARQQLRALRAQSKTDADRNLTLVLALMMAKDHERLQLVFLSQRGTDYATVQGEISSLYEAREQCEGEAWGWLEVKPTDRTTLDAGPCLAEARQAASVLGI